ncbi:MAG TPA: DUF2071 domain-containing protein [Actinobacteria bacterium]|nr:DUF2071 domain-containing protein [Actinomycetota bacterium]
MSLHPASAPVEISEPMMRNEWRDLTFLHWDYDPERVQSVLPDRLTVETWDDRAWVGVVPFRMKVRLPRGPYIPWVSYFPETNCRTYVTGPNGEVGVWFFSLEAARLPAVIAGRLGYGVWYHWAKMSVDQQDGSWEYRSRRRWPGPGPESTASVVVGKAIEPADVTPFQHYLTARWNLFGVRRGQLTFARASHEPWPLHEAIVAPWSDDLISAAGLLTPARAPIALWSPGVNVAIGRPEVL